MADITPLITPMRDYGQEVPGARSLQRFITLQKCVETFVTRLAEHARQEGNTYYAQEAEKFLEEVIKL